MYDWLILISGFMYHYALKVTIVGINWAITIFLEFIRTHTRRVCIVPVPVVH